jgi:hypothetical protein
MLVKLGFLSKPYIKIQETKSLNYLEARRRTLSHEILGCILEKKTKRTKKNTRVSFDPTVIVVLIPSVKEYKHANLNESLWWNQDDIDSFKDCAICDVISFVESHPGLDCEVSLKLLDRI